MNKSICIAFCGIMTALCVVLMFLTGLIPVGTYALPALAGILLVVLVVEMGTSWAWPVYIASSALSVFLAADKEAAMLYVLFFGYYPILKAVIERRRLNTAITYLLKFSVFNVSMIAGYFVSIWVLGVPQDSFTMFGLNLPVLLLIAGNVTFAVYDYAISSVVVTYTRRFHKTVSRLLNRK